MLPKPKPTGQIEVNNHLNNDKFHSDEITSLTININTHTATITGKGTLNGTTGHAFEIIVSDLLEPGTGTNKAIYCRVSTTHKDQLHSLSSQI